MSDRIKNIVLTSLFGVFIIGFMLFSIFLPDGEISKSERRKLQQFPELSVKTVFGGTFMSDFDEYTLDQFPLRDSFRTLKAQIAYNVYLQKDNNGIYIVDGNAVKIEATLDEKSINNIVKKFNTLYDTYLSGCRVFYSIVPDKNYFAADENGCPKLDYDKMRSMLSEGLNSSFKYIDLFDTLEVGDYYRTDSHWKQERLEKTVGRIAGEMGFADRLPDFSSYAKHELSPFYGVYYGQAALPLAPDTITYLTDDVTESAVVYNLEKDEYINVYTTEKFGDLDSYDVYLTGASALLTIENKAQTNGKQLIIFRDSYTSSLAPLLISAYSKITLVDLRYMASVLLPQYVDFEGADVLFLYGTQIYNGSFILK